MEDLSKLSKQELIKKLQEEQNKVNFDFDAEVNRMETLADRHAQPEMPVVERSHKKVYLWKPLGQRCGPFHPTNASRMMKEYRRAGIPIFTKQPTEEQIEAFKKTDIYKQHLIKKEANQEKREKMKRYTPQQWAEAFGEAAVNRLKGANAGVHNKRQPAPTV